MAGLVFLVGCGARGRAPPAAGRHGGAGRRRVAAAAIRPFTTLAFGVLAPVFGLGLQCLWAARHGDSRPGLPARRPAEPSAPTSRRRAPRLAVAARGRPGPLHPIGPSTSAGTQVLPAGWRSTAGRARAGGCQAGRWRTAAPSASTSGAPRSWASPSTRRRRATPGQPAGPDAARRRRPGDAIATMVGELVPTPAAGRPPASDRPPGWSAAGCCASAPTCRACSTPTWRPSWRPAWACRWPSTTTATARRGPRSGRAPRRGHGTPFRRPGHRDRRRARRRRPARPGRPRLRRRARPHDRGAGWRPCACGRLRLLGGLRLGHRAGRLARRRAAAERAPRASWPGPAGDPGACGASTSPPPLLEGDPEAAAVLSEFAVGSRSAPPNLVNVLDPEVIVLGGAMIETWRGAAGADPAPPCPGGAAPRPARRAPGWCAARAGRAGRRVGAALLPGLGRARRI